MFKLTEISDNRHRQCELCVKIRHKLRYAVVHYNNCTACTVDTTLYFIIHRCITTSTSPLCNRSLNVFTVTAQLSNSDAFTAVGHYVYPINGINLCTMRMNKYHHHHHHHHHHICLTSSPWLIKNARMWPCGHAPWRRPCVTLTVTQVAITVLYNPEKEQRYIN